MKFPKQALVNGARRAKRVALIGGAVAAGAVVGAVATTAVAAGDVIVAAADLVVAVTDLAFAPVAGAISGGVAVGVAASTMLDNAPIEGEAVRC